MSIAIRREILKEALDDPDIRLKMDCAVSWDEIKDILREFAKQKGFRVAEVSSDGKIRKV